MISPPLHSIEIQPFRPKVLQPHGLPAIGGQSQILVADGHAYISVGPYWAVVDEADVHLVAGCTWSPVRCSNSRVYAEARSVGSERKFVRRRLHRVIMGCPASLYVDHVDCNPLNNFRANLRVCTPQQNALNTRIRSDNTSGFKGVSFRKDRKKWSAQIKVGCDLIRLGCFKSAEEAHAAYAEAANKYFGEFARAA